MNRTRFKIAVWLGLALIIVALSLLAVWQVGELITRFQEGADPASALNIEPNEPLDWPIELTWRTDTNQSGRAPDPFTRSQIASAYKRAWLQWHFSYTKGEPFGLSTYFGGPALAAIEASIAAASAQGLSVDQTDLRHELELTYFSADGSIAAFTDHHAQVMRMVRNEAGELLFLAETTATYDVIMLLDDGRWRVRHWLRTDDVPSTQAPRRAFLPDGIAGINYYPQATPWALFWPNYDRDVVADDFERMAALGLNAARIFIPYEQFGADAVDSALLDSVVALLDQAERDGIGVIVTLFDFRTDYRLLRWNHADRHLKAIVTALKDHPALLAWDVKNEPDRDYAASGQPLVDAWLEHTIEEVRRHDSATPITIGWSLPERAATLAHAVDFVSFHYYAPADQFGQAVGLLRARVGENRPILLTEFGLPTWNSYFFPNGHTLQEQAAYYADMRRALRDTGLNGYLAWTLYDFTNVPANVSGRFPWQTGPQRHLGIYDANGNAKPAAALLSISAEVDSDPPMTSFERFTKPFWRTVIAVAVALVIVTIVGWRYRRRRISERTQRRRQRQHKKSATPKA